MTLHLNCWYINVILYNHQLQPARRYKKGNQSFYLNTLIQAGNSKLTAIVSE